MRNRAWNVGASIAPNKIWGRNAQRRALKTRYSPIPYTVSLWAAPADYSALFFVEENVQSHFYNVSQGLSATLGDMTNIDKCRSCSRPPVAHHQLHVRRVPRKFSAFLFPMYQYDSVLRGEKCKGWSQQRSEPHHTHQLRVWDFSVRLAEFLILFLIIMY